MLSAFFYLAWWRGLLATNGGDKESNDEECECGDDESDNGPRETLNGGLLTSSGSSWKRAEDVLVSGEDNHQDTDCAGKTKECLDDVREKVGDTCSSELSADEITARHVARDKRLSICRGSC